MEKLKTFLYALLITLSIGSAKGQTINGCGTGSARSLAITVTPRPIATLVTIEGFKFTPNIQ